MCYERVIKAYQRGVSSLKTNSLYRKVQAKGNKRKLKKMHEELLALYEQDFQEDMSTRVSSYDGQAKAKKLRERPSFDL